MAVSLRAVWQALIRRRGRRALLTGYVVLSKVVMDKLQDLVELFFIYYSEIDMSYSIIRKVIRFIANSFAKAICSGLTRSMSAHNDAQSESMCFLLLL